MAWKQSVLSALFVISSIQVGSCDVFRDNYEDISYDLSESQDLMLEKLRALILDEHEKTRQLMVTQIKKECGCKVDDNQKEKDGMYSRSSDIKTPMRENNIEKRTKRTHLDGMAKSFSSPSTTLQNKPYQDQDSHSYSSEERQLNDTLLLSSQLNDTYPLPKQSDDTLPSSTQAEDTLSSTTQSDVTLPSSTQAADALPLTTNLDDTLPSFNQTDGTHSSTNKQSDDTLPLSTISDDTLPSSNQTDGTHSSTTQSDVTLTQAADTHSSTKQSEDTLPLSTQADETLLSSTKSVNTPPTLTQTEVTLPLSDQTNDTHPSTEQSVETTTESTITTKTRKTLPSQNIVHHEPTGIQFRYWYNPDKQAYVSTEIFKDEETGGKFYFVYKGSRGWMKQYDGDGANMKLTHHSTKSPLRNLGTTTLRSTATTLRSTTKKSSPTTGTLRMKKAHAIIAGKRVDFSYFMGSNKRLQSIQSWRDSENRRYYLEHDLARGKWVKKFMQ